MSGRSFAIVTSLYVWIKIKDWYAKSELLPQWMVMSFVGQTCSAIAVAIIVNLPIINALPFHIKSLLGLALFLWGLGKAQQTIIIKLFGKLSERWAVATMAASIPIFFICCLLSLLPPSFNKLPLSGFFVSIIFCGLVGLSIGRCQWFVIKQYPDKFNLWSIANILQVILVISAISISISTYQFSRSFLGIILVLLSPSLSSIITGLALKKICSPNSSK